MWPERCTSPVSSANPFPFPSPPSIPCSTATRTSMARRRRAHSPTLKEISMPKLTTSLDAYEVWFLTGSQNLYGEETLKQVAEQSQEIARTLGAASDVPVKVVWKPVLK